MNQIPTPSPRTTRPSSRRRGLLLLLGLWAVVNGVEWLWIRGDESIPGWDEAKHLVGSLSYLEAFQDGRWHDVWRVSNKYPPLTYMLAALTQRVWGPGNDQALLINWGLSAVVVAAACGIAWRLFGVAAGLWAGAIVLVLPRLSSARLAFLTDTTLAASTVLAFACLTCWHFATNRRSQWLWAAAFGGSLGLALLTKQTSLLFLAFPVLAAVTWRVWRRRWEQVLQAAAGLLLAVLMSGPWYRTNWVYAISSFQSGIMQAAINEGDPPVLTWAAWTYYLLDLPSALSWVWLIVPAMGFLVFRATKGPAPGQEPVLPLRTCVLWIGLYVVGSYVLLSLLRNKDPRYIMPCMPVLAVLAAYGMSLWPARWRAVPWASLGLALVLWWSALFPWPHQGTVLGVSPRRAEPVRPYPAAEVIDTVIRTTPHLRANIGVIPSVFQFNHNNVGYFGALRGFQVLSRELGSRPTSVAQDACSFDWLIASGAPLPDDHARAAQIELGRRLANDPAFELVQSWTLAAGRGLSLYHRRRPLVAVRVLTQPPSGLRLQVTVPTAAAIGAPIPVTYRWSGDWRTLENGFVLLTWSKRGEAGPTDQFWVHDHRIGFGTLFTGVNADLPRGLVEVTETTAMLAPVTLEPGRFALGAEYVDLRSGARRPIALRAVEIALDHTPLGYVGPELDWLTQLRELAPLMNEGVPGLERVFDQVARIGRYAATRDYVRQVLLSLELRLQSRPATGSVVPTARQRAQWHLARALAHVLDEDSAGAIRSLEALIQLTPDNPYPYVYLTVVHLYDGHPGLARQALQPALTMAPELPEVQIMDAATRLMRGQVFQAFDRFTTLRARGLL